MRPITATILLLLATAACAPRVPDSTPRSGGAAEFARSPAPRGASAPDALALARQAFGEGRLVEAEGLFRRAAAADPTDPEPLAGLASTHLAQRRFSAAVADLDAAIALRDGARARTLRGRALGLSRRFDAAAEDLERAVALDPRATEAWAALVAVQVNRGDVVEARRAFAGALAASPRSAAVGAVWTQLLAMPPDPAQAQEALDRCTRGYAALLDGEPGEAERECRGGMKSSPAFPWCAAVHAETLWWAQDTAGAERGLRAAIAAFPASQVQLAADARGRLAALLVTRPAAAGEAAKLARAALAVRGERGALLDTLGRACDAFGDAPCAADAYARLLRLTHLPDAMRTSAEERLRALRGPRDRDARFRILQDRRWGYVDRDGRVVIPPRFDAADPFSEGLAAVRQGDVLGYVDLAGTLVLVPTFGAAGPLVHRPFLNGRAVVKAGDRLGAIDRAGKLVVPARYTELGDFSDGLALACDGEAYGWIDRAGQGVLGPAMMGGKAARGGVATGFDAMGMGRNSAFLYRAGRGRLPQEYEDTGNFREGLVAVRIDDRWGYVDGSGEPVIPLRFAWAGDFSEGLAPARTDRVLCGYVDRTGAFAIPARFRECAPFSSGLARVDLAATESDRAQVAFIDHAGNPVIVGARADPPFDDAADFVDGLAAVSQGGPPFLVAPHVPGSPRLGYVDERGRYVWIPTR
jgi:tetratricopeptide (TPR) repeat protein